MGATYTRQSTYEDGDTITAAHTNDEFDQLLAAFQASTGHTHDGTANEGGPINKLLSNTLTFGAATSGTDVTITFDGESNDGVLAWMEDEDYFKFSDDIMIIDDEKLIFGSDSNVAVSYDEATTDSLKIAATEGAGLAITLMADEGDDAGDEWKLNIADGGTLTLGNDINSAGTYVTHLTITPNSTVASSTMAVAGNLTVGGSLTLGSGAVLAEAELEMIDGITAGTVAASKAVVVDANKDAASFRNITLTGELDAGSLDVSGDADIDGTLEADAITVGGTALNTVIAGVTVTNATTAAVATTVTISDNESTNEENAIIFTAGGDVDGGNIGLESDGDLAYNPSTGTVTATIFKGNIDAVDGDFDGTLEADAITLDGTAITATATLSTGISNNNVPKFTSGVADNDFLRVDGTAIEGRSASEVLSDIGGQASLTFGISNTNIPIFTSGVADDDFLRIDGTSVEGRSASEVLSDIGGQASLTFGISNTNAVKIDSASVADDEYARFTANGLESRSTSEVASDIGAATQDDATALAIALG